MKFLMVFNIIDFINGHNFMTVVKLVNVLSVKILSHSLSEDLPKEICRF